MKLFMLACAFLFLAFTAYAKDETNTQGQPQTIYINNEIPAEILRAYNDQAALISDMRLKIQELEHQLFQATERLKNLETEVWEMSASQKMKAYGK